MNQNTNTNTNTNPDRVLALLELVREARHVACRNHTQAALQALADRNTANDVLRKLDQVEETLNVVLEWAARAV